MGAKNKPTRCTRSHRNKQPTRVVSEVRVLPTRGCFGEQSLAVIPQTSRAWGDDGWLEERITHVPTGRESSTVWPFGQQLWSSLSMCWRSLMITSRNGDYFNSLFYGVACPKLYQRVRQQINIIEKFVSSGSHDILHGSVHTHLLV